mgnify:CR=1 FL=1
MFTLNELLLFAAAALVLVLTPGPNMVYCVSRSLTQGPRAGLLSLAGVVLGFLVHLFAAALGLTALLLAVPMTFDVIRIAGALYLLWMAWQAVRSGGAAPFQARRLPHDGPKKLFAMGFMTNVLNPKVAMFYLAFAAACCCKACCWAQSRSQSALASMHCWCCLPAACRAFSTAARAGSTRSAI